MRRKPIACSAHGLDVMFKTVRCQCFAQAQNVYVYRAFFHVHIASPSVVQQLFTAVYAVGVLHEEFQQAEFGGAKVEFLCHQQ